MAILCEVPLNKDTEREREREGEKDRVHSTHTKSIPVLR